MTYDTTRNLALAEQAAKDTISHAVASGEAKESERVVAGLDNVIALLDERGFLARGASLTDAADTVYDALYNDVEAAGV